MKQICKICNVEKSIDEFRKTFFKRKNKYYYRKECKICENEKSKKYSKHNKEKIKEYYQKNKEKLNEYSKKWGKEYRKNDYVKKKNNQRSKKYYNSNKEKRLQYQNNYNNFNKEKRLQYQKKYEQSEIGKLKRKIINNKRRAQKLSSSDDTVTLESVLKLKEIQNNKCFYYNFCGNNLDNFTLEHMIPLSKGGIHSMKNISLACPKCNSSKNNKTHEEYLKYLKNRQLR